MRSLRILLVAPVSISGVQDFPPLPSSSSRMPHKVFCNTSNSPLRNISAETRKGFSEGMESVRKALNLMASTGQKDINYWKDSVRWLVWASNILQERSFSIASLQLMAQICEHLGDSIRFDVLRRACTIRPVQENVDVLEKLLWLLAEITPIECNEAIVSDLVTDLVGKVLLVDGLSAVRVEIIPSLLRLTTRLAAGDDLFYGLCKLIVRDYNVSGKALWTLADLLDEKVDLSPRMEYDWSGLIRELGVVLLRTSSLKAKSHLARCLGRVVSRDDCPLDLAIYVEEMLGKCQRWLENECTADAFDLDEELFERYCSSLTAKLSRP